MLGKLLKYELKATYKLLLATNGAVLFFAVINMIANLLGDFSLETLNDNSFVGIMTIVTLLSAFGIFILALSASGIVTLILLVRRFQSNLMGDEGYLSFTLPVSATQLLNAKLLSGWFWLTINGIVGILALVIVTPTSAYPFILEVLEMFPTVHLVLLGVETIFLGLISPFFSLLMFYFCVAFAYTRNRYRVLYGVGAYFVLQFVLQTVSGIGTTVYNLIVTTSFTDMSVGEAMAVDSPFWISSHVMMMAGFVFTVVAIIGLYLGSNHILKNKINLS